MVFCVITEYRGIRFIAMIRDGIIEDLIPFYDDEKPKAGDIILGKVSDKVPGIQSAFVNLGEIKAYLPISGDSGIKAQDELPVLITKEASGNKEAVASSRLSLTGRYCVIQQSKGKPVFRISARITEPDERKRLEDGLKDIAEDFDIIIRTKAMDQDMDLITDEIRSLMDKLSHIVEIAPSRTVYTRLYEADMPYVTAIRDCRIGEVTKVITDIPRVYNTIRERMPDVDISLYEDKMLPLAKLHKIASTVDSVTERIVWLKSGAYIVIDETEAMTVIDVNSGRFSKDKSREESFYMINSEAVSEIARQLRIRNLSGIIMVDLINMKNRSDYDRLVDEMKQVFACDSQYTTFIDFTRLGLCELTRKKVRRPLREVLNDA